mmetsp:Transcript_18100/g.27302  ORF Transcript_18100/g.27302 Transcript_18100/m.27302 type:complete len:228 (-) Transcript_18100:34-717(-)
MAQQKLLKDPRWLYFEYIFYTESDQIIHLRSLDSLILALDQNQHSDYGSFLIPHRVMPVPSRRDLGPEHIDHPDTIKRNRKGLTILDELARNDAKTLHWTKNSFRSHSCCFDKAPCSHSRDHWRPFESSYLHLFRVCSYDSSTCGDEADFRHSFALLAGEGNFLEFQFRTCSFSRTRSLLDFLAFPQFYILYIFLLYLFFISHFFDCSFFASNFKYICSFSHFFLLQ